jgi:DNA invertase Pin-like site-specific DNA recombinase
MTPPRTRRSAASKAAAVYVRRSHADAKIDNRSGRSLAEQEADCRDLAARLGLDVVEVFSEREGTGASRHSRKARPQWEAALAALDTGDTFQTLVVWALDRADRRGAVEVGRLLDAHADGSRRVVGVDGTDTGDPKRRLETIIRAEIARDEADRTSERVRRTKRHTRAEGLWLGGPPPFGLAVVDRRVAPDPETYPVARRIAEQLLNGRSVFAVVKDLNEERIPTPSGHTPGEKVKRLRAGREETYTAAWSTQPVLQIVKSPAFAGLQSERRRLPSGNLAAIADVFLDDNGDPVSVGEGVITPRERSRILDALSARARETGRKTKADTAARSGKRGTSTLLGDLLRCPACDGRAGTTGRSDDPRRAYRCAGVASGSCPGFTAPIADLDDYVGRRFLLALAAEEPGSDLLAAVAERWIRRNAPDEIAALAAASDAVEEAQAALDRLDDDRADGLLDATAYKRQRERLGERLRLREERLSSLPRPEAHLGALLDPLVSVEAWNASDLVERRALLALAIDRVEVSRAGWRGRAFEPLDRVRIVWADGAESAPADWPTGGAS